MTISYPLTLPTSPGVKRVNLRQASAVAVSQNPYTLSAQIQKHAGQMWGADISLPMMTRAQAEAWFCFLLKLNGQEGTFLLGDPTAKNPRGVGMGTPLVNGGSQTGQTLNTKGWPISTTGLLLAGDFLSIGYRLYKALGDVSSDASGYATIDIWPRLRDIPADNQVISISDCKGLFRLADNGNPIFSASEDKLYDFSFSCVEAI
jgi:hypothetical protein